MMKQYHITSIFQSDARLCEVVVLAIALD